MRTASLTLLLFHIAMPLLCQQTDLHPAWTYVPGGRVVVPPIVGGDGDVALLCEDRYVYRLSPEGVLRWRANLMRPPEHGTLGADGGLVCALATGEVVGVSPAGGVLYRTARRFEVSWRPLLGLEGLVHISYPSGRLEARSPGGRLLWSEDVIDGISAAPVLVGGVTVIGTRGGRLIGLDRYGASLWDVWLGTEASALAASTDGRVFVGTAEGRIVAVGTSGTTFWEVFTEGAVTEMRVGPRFVAYATASGVVGRLSLDGRILDVDTLSDPPRDVFVTDRGIVVLESAGRLRDLGGGEIRIRGIRGDAILMAAVGRDGSLIVASPTWEVGYYRTDIVPRGPWPVSGGGPARAGRSENDRAIDRPSSRYGANLNYLFLRDRLFSPYQAEVSEALDEMLRDARDSELRGKLGYYRDLATQLLARAFTRVSRGEGTVLLPAAVRIKVVELLGLLGDSGSRIALAEYSRYEKDSAVLLQYLRSFATVKSDPDGALLERTSRILLENPNRRIYESAVPALDALGRYAGMSETWRRLVFVVINSDVSAETRQSAARLLDRSN